MFGMDVVVRDVFDQLELSARSANLLKAEGINTLAGFLKLMSRTDKELLSIRGFGARTLEELRAIQGDCIGSGGTGYGHFSSAIRSFESELEKLDRLAKQHREAATDHMQRAEQIDRAIKEAKRSLEEIHTVREQMRRLAFNDPSRHD